MHVSVKEEDTSRGHMCRLCTCCLQISKDSLGLRVQISQDNLGFRVQGLAYITRQPAQSVPPSVHPPTHTHTHPPTHTHRHIHIHIHTYTYTHTYNHAYIHIYAATNYPACMQGIRRIHAHASQDFRVSLVSSLTLLYRSMRMHLKTSELVQFSLVQFSLLTDP